MQASRRFLSVIGFAGGVLVTLAVAAGLNLFTYLDTYDAPAADGMQMAGFPLTFWWSGGRTPAGAPAGGVDRSAAVIDALIAVVVAGVLGIATGLLLPRLIDAGALGAGPRRRR